VDKLQKTADIHGLKLTGKLTIYENCALAKARQMLVRSGKDLVKYSEKEST
jgi:hypothetical protein